MFKYKKGFTLIELLVVIAIIGLLASIVLVSLNSARQKARDSRRLTDIRQVALALELYADTNNSAYPTVTGCTAANWSGTMTTCLEGTGAAPCNVSYMTRVPVDPSNGATYFYAYASTGADYVLKGRLEITTNPAMSTDIDGDVLSCTTANGASCNDPAYCVSP
jgi:type II secretion system protein G